MAKEVKSVLKLQIQAGQANPSPPVGPALGQAGVNIMGFCKEFNAATQGSAGDLLPTVITVYKDASFSFVTKQPPAAVLLKKAAGLASAQVILSKLLRFSLAPPCRWGLRSSGKKFNAGGSQIL